MTSSQHDREIALQQANTPEAKLAALNSLSEVLCEVDPDRALQLASEAYDLARLLGDSEKGVVAILNSAWAQYNKADYSGSMMSVQDGLREARSLHLEKQEFDALTILGNNYNVIGNWADALGCFTQALAISKRLDNPRRVATTLSNIGQQYAASGKFEEALDHYLQCLDILRKSSISLVTLTHVLLNVNETYNKLGEHQTALAYSEEGLQTAQKGNYGAGQALALLYTGNTYRYLGDKTTSLSFYNRALEQIERSNTPLYEGYIYRSIALLLAEMGHTAQALAYLHKALTIFQMLDAKPEVFEVHHQLAQAYSFMGDFAFAYEQFQAFHEVKEQVFNEQADNRQKAMQALYEVEQARLEAEAQYNRNLTLQGEIEQSEQVIRELDAYADNVAHDLRNPIGVIVGFGSLLDMNLGDTLDEESKTYLTNVLTAADKMNEIVESLLTLARARKEEILPKVVDMDSVLDEALKRTQTLIVQQKVTIERAESLPVAMGNDAWLEDAFVNYITNGIKYGGDNPHLVIGATGEPNGFVRYWVSDNGPGLDEQAMKMLFKRFERLGQQKIEGHGLGLTIVKTIVEKLGGRVQVESSGIAGQGCTFSFTLKVPA
ncbi:MAG: tetratricopeptide repeat protein [Anaerolineaceae bacterium]|nr:tetratricopeptide repeat protein [Anaerolineaceae bacterium]